MSLYSIVFLNLNHFIKHELNMNTLFSTNYELDLNGWRHLREDHMDPGAVVTSPASGFPETTTTAHHPDAHLI